MLILDSQTSADSLAALCREACELLCAGNYSLLAEKFGYALAYEREPSAAIQQELAQSLEELHASRLEGTPAGLPSVKYFQPNETGLYALAEQDIPTDNGKHVLLELIITDHPSGKHVALEQISAAA